MAYFQTKDGSLEESIRKSVMEKNLLGVKRNLTRIKMVILMQKISAKVKKRQLDRRKLGWSKEKGVSELTKIKKKETTPSVTKSD